LLNVFYSFVVEALMTAATTVKYSYRRATHCLREQAGANANISTISSHGIRLTHNLLQMLHLEPVTKTSVDRALHPWVDGFLGGMIAVG
jgi:hypothetical protein